MQHVVLIGQIGHALQAYLNKKDIFLNKVAEVRRQGGFRSEAALCRFTKLSRSLLNAIREGHIVTDKTMDKVDTALEQLSKKQLGELIVQESLSKYGNDLRNFRKQEEDPSSLKLNSAFRPPAAELTAPQCVRHVTEYLSEVSQVPGAVGRVWTQLQLHLPLSEARLLREQHERSYPELYEHE